MEKLIQFALRNKVSVGLAIMTLPAFVNGVFFSYIGSTFIDGFAFMAFIELFIGAMAGGIILLAIGFVDKLMKRK
jgi:hypothetical protein